VSESTWIWCCPSLTGLEYEQTGMHTSAGRDTSVLCPAHPTAIAMEVPPVGWAQADGPDLHELGDQCTNRDP
jgi:hypothetical protein